MIAFKVTCARASTFPVIYKLKRHALLNQVSHPGHS